MRKGYRTEKDVLGKVKVPKDAFYGIQTERASKNFPISGLRIHPELNNAILQIKIAAAEANVKLKTLDNRKGKYIIKAAREILRGKLNGEFIIDVFQAGAGTPWHMNVNEVVANVALKMAGKKKGQYNIIDPHDDVNRGQSTNDVIPSSIRIASIALIDKLVPELNNLIKTLDKKGREFNRLVKSGRTHLQDAVPITLGQEFSAWASTMKKRLKILHLTRNNLLSLSIGGTAVGTGINAEKGFDIIAVNNLRKLTKLNLRRAENKIEETQFMSDFLDLSSALRSIAADLGKIANDIRLLASGPKTGFNELKLPEVEPGSSIMPGKFNPSMAEMMNMVCYQVMGNDEAIKECVSAGQLELNVMTPVIAHNLLQSLDILRNGIKEFNLLCLKGIKANKPVLQRYFETTPAAGAILNHVVGYDRAAALVKEAIKNDRSVKSLAVERKLLTKKEAEHLFDVKNFI